MRLLLIILGLLLLAQVGCNADPRCRRETALLRAEIMDLEDKYYLTKSQRDEALALLYGQGKTEQAAKIKARGPIDPNVVPSSSGIQEMIHDDGQYLHSSPHFVDETFYDGSSDPMQSEIIFDGMSLPARPLETTPSQSGLFQAPATQDSTLRTSPGQSSPGQSSPGQSNPRQSNPRQSNPRQSDPRQSNPSDSILESEEELPEAKSSAVPGASSAPANQGSQNRIRTRSTSPDTELTASNPGSPVTEIVVDRNQTVFETDEGSYPTLTVLLKPRDARGQSRRVAGTLTVSIVDPEAMTPDQRIGIWKFLPEEVELFFTEPNSEPGIRLNLPFEDKLPQGKLVAVLVRLELNDGRALETTARISTSESAPRIKLPQADDDQLAERDDAPSATPTSSPRPAWRPVR